MSNNINDEIINHINLSINFIERYLLDTPNRNHQLGFCQNLKLYLIKKILNNDWDHNNIYKGSMNRALKSDDKYLLYLINKYDIDHLNYFNHWVLFIDPNDISIKFDGFHLTPIQNFDLNDYFLNQFEVNEILYPYQSKLMEFNKYNSTPITFSNSNTNNDPSNGNNKPKTIFYENGNTRIRGGGVLLGSNNNSNSVANNNNLKNKQSTNNVTFVGPDTQPKSQILFSTTTPINTKNIFLNSFNNTCSTSLTIS